MRRSTTAFLALAAATTGCGSQFAGSAIEVLVVAKGSVAADCIEVGATGPSGSEVVTARFPRNERTEFHVAVAPGADLGTEEVLLVARGYSGAGCNALIARSAVRRVRFAPGITSVTLALAPCTDGCSVGSSDAGDADGGTPDAGTGGTEDAGLDAGSDAGEEPDGGLDGGFGDDGGYDAGDDAGFDAGNPMDAGDGTGTDAGSSVDAGGDAGFDAGSPADAGVDAGFDAGTVPDAGADAGTDAGSPVDAGTDAGLGPPVWVQVGVAPVALNGGRMTYHGGLKKILLYGGDTLADNAHPSGDMWSYDGATSTWTLVCSPCTPGPREGHGFVYDKARDRLVIFGGKGTTGVATNDIWEWDGLTWAARTPAGTPPPARQSFYMAYDESRSRVVVFGGMTAPGSTNTDQVYEYDGTSWYGPFTPTPRPSVRRSLVQAAAYDSINERVLIYSSETAGTDDLWAWDGTAWTQLRTSCLGIAGHDSALTFDPVRGVLFLVDAFYPSGEWDGLVQFDGGTCTRLGPGDGTPRDSQVCFFDPAHNKHVCTGGNTCGNGCNFNQTWELR